MKTLSFKKSSLRSATHQHSPHRSHLKLKKHLQDQLKVLKKHFSKPLGNYINKGGKDA